MRILIFIIPTLISLSCFGQEKKYQIVFLNRNTEAAKLSDDETKRIMEGHMGNMKKLSEEGRLLIAGPFEGGGGIFVMNSTSPDEVTRWISTDPGIQAKRWKVEIMPFIPRHGSVCPVGESYEMTHYSFVRFDAIVTKHTAATQAQLMQQHNQYIRQIIQTGNVVSEAIFGELDGGILILKGETDQDLVNGDPAVQQGLIEPQLKKLYIAKGSFCEQ
jgi:uncharacterized protein YciI